MSDKKKTSIRGFVLWPALAIVVLAGVIGLVDGDTFSQIFNTIFSKSIDYLGWVYQLFSAFAFVVAIIITFSKKGRITIGGKEAKARYSFSKWFAMSLTGGIATGIITYSVSQPLTYFLNISGELDSLKIKAGSTDAAVFSLARIFHEWTFIPYAIFSVCGLSVAYMCFNKKKSISVASALIPVVGEKHDTEAFRSVVDFLCVMAMILGLAGSLGSGITLIATGLNTVYGIPSSTILIFGITAVFTALYMFSAIRGVDKGVQFFANMNTKLFYIILLFLFLSGPTIYILNSMVTSLGDWGKNLSIWMLDTGMIGGEALVKWWTIANCTFFIAFAPITGVFLAQISYGRTIREFMITNWIGPSVFSILWFSVWGGTAVHWQQTGVMDFADVMHKKGTLSAFWLFIQRIPLWQILIPIIMIMLILSFSTAADSNITTISTLCIKDTKIGEEAPVKIKLTWGMLCALIAYLLIVFTKDQTGLSGIKAMGAVGGLFMLPIVILQIFSVVKMFFGKEKE